MTKSTHFNLVVGQEEDMMLNIIFQLAFNNPEHTQELVGHGLVDAVDKFKDQMAAGTRKVMWCNFKGCKGGKCKHKK